MQETEAQGTKRPAQGPSAHDGRRVSLAAPNLTPSASLVKYPSRPSDRQKLILRTEALNLSYLSSLVVDLTSGPALIPHRVGTTISDTSDHLWIQRYLPSGWPFP